MADRMTRFAMYNRVSTAEQDSFAVQRDACQRYAAAQPNWVLAPDSATSDGVYVDTMSGLDDDRPAYQRMLAAVRAGQIDAVLVWKYDRLGRNDTEMIGLTNELVRRRVRMASAVEGENPPFVVKLLGLLAAEESANTSKRVTAQMRMRTELGYWTNRAPLGYTVVRAGEDGKMATLEADPLTAPIVRELFERAAVGDMGIPSLVDWLNNASDAEGNPLRPWASAVFTQSTVRDMLHNTTYVGEVRRERRASKVDGYRILDADEQIHAQGKHEAIVPRDLFDAVQQELRERTRRHYGNIATGNYLLSGLLVCGVCRRRMQGHSLRLRRWPADHKPDRTYRCDQRGHGTAGMVWLDRWVLACVSALPLTEDAISAVRTLLANRDGNAPGRIDALQKERADLEHKLSTLGDMLLSDPTPAVRRMFDAKSATISDRLMTLESDLKTLLAPTRAINTALGPIVHWLRQAGELNIILGQGTTAQKAEIIAGAVERIIFNGKGDPTIVWHPWAAALMEANGVILPKVTRRAGRPTLQNHPVSGD